MQTDECSIQYSREIIICIQFKRKCNAVLSLSEKTIGQTAEHESEKKAAATQKCSTAVSHPLLLNNVTLATILIMVSLPLGH